MDITVTGPCGHTTSLDLAYNGPDRFRCATCSAQWRIETVGKPQILRSGFVIPPKRRIVLESNPSLPQDP